MGTTAVIGLPSEGGGVTTPCIADGELGFLSGKSGVVLALGGAPVRGGAVGFAGTLGNGEVGASLGGSCGMLPEGGRERLGIGLVTAVDHAGADAPPA